MSSYKRSYGSKKRSYGGVSKAATKKQKNLTSADVKRLAKQMIAKSVEEKEVFCNLAMQFGSDASNALPLTVHTVGTYSGTSTSSVTFPVLAPGAMNDQREGDSVMMTGLKLQCSLQFDTLYVNTTADLPISDPACRVVIVRYKSVLPDLTSAVAANDSTFGWADSAAIASLDRTNYFAPIASRGQRECTVVYDRKFVGPDVQKLDTAGNLWELPTKRYDFEVDLTSKVKGKKLHYNDPTLGTATNCSGQIAVYIVRDNAIASPDHHPYAKLTVSGKLTFKELE